MRIVAGRFKSLGLASPKSRDIRPTSDRLRETVFNILEHGFGMTFDGSRVLDLFAGTGALGLEALSRGASAAVFIDTSVEARGLLRQNIEKTGTGGIAKVFRRDCTRLGAAGTLAPFDLCFADPPYNKGLGVPALASAAEGGWLVEDALCVLEEAANAETELPVGFTMEDERVIGESSIRFLLKK